MKKLYLICFTTLCLFALLFLSACSEEPDTAYNDPDPGITEDDLERTLCSMIIGTWHASFVVPGRLEGEYVYTFLEDGTFTLKNNFTNAIETGTIIMHGTWYIDGESDLIMHTLYSTSSGREEPVPWDIVETYNWLDSPDVKIHENHADWHMTEENLFLPMYVFEHFVLVYERVTP